MEKSNIEELPQVNIEISIGAKMIELAQLDSILSHQSLTDTERTALQEKKRNVLGILNWLLPMMQTCKYGSTYALEPTTKIEYPCITQKKV